MRGLAMRHEVSILAFNKKDAYADGSTEATRAYCHEVFCISERDVEGPDYRKRVGQMLSLATPWTYDYLAAKTRRDFQRKLDGLLASGRYDLVQVEFAQLGAFDYERARRSRIPVVLDEHNIEYDLQRRSAGGAGSLSRKVYSAVNWRKLRLEERAFWKRCDGVITTSERDHAIITEYLPAAQSVVVPNGADVDAFRPADIEPDPDRIMFFGAINYYPNQEGLVYFLDEVFPRILARRPATKLWIVGPGAPAIITQRQAANIEVTGFVDDVNTYLDQSRVVIVPLRIGGGTRLKIVEAMAKSKAIVSTRVGAEGLEVVDREHLLLADSPQEFADRVLELLDDQALGKRIGAAARELAVSRYSWSAIVEILEGFYQRVRTK